MRVVSSHVCWRVWLKRRCDAFCEGKLAAREVKTYGVRSGIGLDRSVESRLSRKEGEKEAAVASRSAQTRRKRRRGHSCLVFAAPSVRVFIRLSPER